MDKDAQNAKEKTSGSLNANEETFNGNFTAIPKEISSADQASTDADLVVTAMDYGEMNVADAHESGYTDDEGHAVAMAKEDVEGSPTGAYTDIGAGRSSVVHKKH